MRLLLKGDDTLLRSRAWKSVHPEPELPFAQKEDTA
jgi:hypothetical protein